MRRTTVLAVGLIALLGASGGLRPPLAGAADPPRGLQPRPLPPNFTPSTYRSIVPPPSLAARRAAPLPSGFPAGGRQLSDLDVVPASAVAAPAPTVTAREPAAAPPTGRWLGPPPWMKGQAGQAPPNPPLPQTAPAATKPADGLTHFRPEAVEVRRDRGRWLLYYRGEVLKDCGEIQGDAYEALKFLRSARIDARGVVGPADMPYLEYWLSDGRVPGWRNVTHRETVVTPATLAVEERDGHWWLRDARTLLVDCGPSEADARRAEAVFRTHHVNRVGFVGRGRPVLMYLLSDPNPPPGGGPPPPKDPSKVGSLPQLFRREAVMVPGLGPVGEKVRFDPNAAEAASAGGGAWALYLDGRPAARFGRDESSARASARLVREYRLDEWCTAGGLTFFLSGGEPPRGARVGTAAKGFDPGRLEVAADPAGGWAVRCGPESLWRFADRPSAERAVAVVRAFGFDTLVRAGPPGGGGLTFPIRSR